MTEAKDREGHLLKVGDTVDIVSGVGIGDRGVITTLTYGGLFTAGIRVTAPNRMWGSQSWHKNVRYLRYVDSDLEMDGGL